MSVTMHDVARKAGVSTKTVSRVVNKEGGYSKETQREVLAAIEELGYHRSGPARSLVQGKSNAVGLVIPLSARRIFSHLYFSQVFRGIAEVLSDSSMDLLVYLARDNTPYVGLYQERRVDGLILMSIPTGDPSLDGLVESGAPSVFTCRIAEQDNPTHWVDADYLGGVAQSIDHLVALGHKRIGLMAGPSNLVAVQLRVRAYTETMIKHGITPSPEHIVYGDFDYQIGLQLTRELMIKDPHPTALICGDDMMALGAIQGVHELGARVPEDVSIIGFDDIILAEHACPPLTTVRQDAYEKGRTAARMLIPLISATDSPRPSPVLLDTRLMIRKSSGPVGRDV